MNKDNKVLIYSTRAISSIYSKLLVEQMNIVENFADDVHIMTHTKTDKSYKLAKDIYLNIDTFIPRDEYLKYISKSKYTLIIPSYDRTQVSILRILESIHNNCIPLFTPDNNFDILLKSFPDFNYKDYILDENFKQFSEDEWNDKLKHCKNVFMQIKDFSIKGL